MKVDHEYEAVCLLPVRALPSVLDLSTHGRTAF